jgi:hypothetical protein
VVTLSMKFVTTPPQTEPLELIERAAQHHPSVVNARGLGAQDVLTMASLPAVKRMNRGPAVGPRGRPAGLLERLPSGHATTTDGDR